jgi:hypothetical protein
MHGDDNYVFHLHLLSHKSNLIKSYMLSYASGTFWNQNIILLFFFQNLQMLVQLDFSWSRALKECDQNDPN